MTWQPTDVRVDTGSVDTDNKRICCDGLNVCVAWGDRTQSDAGIFVNCSFDGGATWQQDAIRISEPHSGVGGDNASFDVSVRCSGQRVYAAWIDNRNGQPGRADNDIYFDYSEDGGLTWQDDDIRFNTDQPAAEDSGPVKLCCDGRSVYAVWGDNRDGENDIYFNSSQDGGANWQASDQRLDSSPAGSVESDNPQICCNGLSVYVAWDGDRQGPERHSIFLNRSSDGGLTWEASDIRIDNDPASAENVQICCDGLSVYVAWEDDRDDPVHDDVFFNYSTDGGVTWQASDIRVDTDPPDTNGPDDLRVCCGGGYVYVSWGLDDNPGDIYLNRATP